MATGRNIQHVLKQAQRRVLVQHAIRFAGWGVALALLAAMVFLFADRLAGLRVPVQFYFLFPVAGLVGGVVYALLNQTRRLAIAVQLDRSLNLKDRIGTFESLAMHSPRDLRFDEDFAELVNRDAQQLAGKVDLKSATPIRFTGVWGVAFAMGALLWLGVWLAPVANWGHESPLAKAQPPEHVIQQAREITQTIQQAVSNLPKRDSLDPQSQAQADALDRLAEQLANNNAKSPEDVQKARDESAAKMDELAQRIAEQSQRDLAAAEEVAKRFQGMDKIEGPKPPMTAEEFSRALRRGDFGEAARQLDSLLNDPKMTPSEREAAAQHLRELARKLDDSSNKPLTDQDRKEMLAQALRDQGVDPKSIDELLNEKNSSPDNESTPTAEEIQKALREQGVDPETAQRFARDLEKLRKQEAVNQQADQASKTVKEALDRAADDVENPADSPSSSTQPAPASQPSVSPDSQPEQTKPQAQSQNSNPATQPQDASPHNDSHSSDSHSSDSHSGHNPERDAKQTSSQSQPQSSATKPSQSDDKQQTRAQEKDIEQQQSQAQPESQSEAQPNKSESSKQNQHSQENKKESSTQPASSQQSTQSDQQKSPGENQSQKQPANQSQPAPQKQAVSQQHSQAPSQSEPHTQSQPSQQTQDRSQPDATKPERNGDQPQTPGQKQPSQQQQGRDSQPSESQQDSQHNSQSENQQARQSSDKNDQSQQPDSKNTPSEVLRRLAQQRDNAKQNQQVSERMREAARELAQKMSPQEREQWARQWARQNGEQPKPPADSSQQPQQIASENLDQNQDRDSSDEHRMAGAAHEPGNQAGSDTNGLPRTDSRQSPDQLASDQKHPIDLRGEESNDQSIAQWSDPNAKPSDNRAASGNVIQRVHGAQEVAERAVNDSAVQKRYHKAIKKYFGRLNETMKKATGEAPANPSPSSPATQP